LEVKVIMNRYAFIVALVVTLAVTSQPHNTAVAQASPWTCAPSSSSRSVTAQLANIRAAPNTKSRVLGTLARNAVICPSATATDGRWYELVASDGARGFVFAALTTNSVVLAKLPFRPFPVTSQRTGPVEFGVQVDVVPALDNLKQIGFGWVKRQVVFERGTPDQRALIDQIHAAGMKLLIGAVGDRARVNQPDYQREFAAGLAELARQGADAIEVWNQPNLDREWGGSDTNLVNPESYAAMLRVAYPAIKAANPKTLVIGANMAATGYFGGNCTPGGCDDKPYLERLYSAGAAAFMDCQGVQSLSHPHGPDRREGGNPGGHYSWYFEPTLDVAHNSMDKPLCIMFLGYATKDGIRDSMPPGFGWADRVTLAKQAEWSARSVEIVRRRTDVQLAIFYNWNFRAWYDSGDPQSAYSLVRPDGTCPSCAALKAALAK
jgi:hypothetical protein